jgi:hypothetical protein
MGPAFEYMAVAGFKAAIVLLAGFALLAASSAAQLGWVGSGVILAAAAVLSLLPLGTLDEHRSRALDRAGLAVLLALSAAGLLWALSYDAVQASDFGIYFECGAHRLEAAFCDSRYIDLGSVYVDRSRFYTALLSIAFPGSYTALKIFNAALHALALAGIWALLRRHLGAAAALLGLVLFGLNPERLYAISLATPDNLSQVLVVALFGLTARVRPARPWLTAVLLGIIVHLVDQLRSIGPFAFFAVAVWALIGREGELRRSLMRLAVTAATWMLCASATRLWNALPPPDLFWPALTGLSIRTPQMSPSFPWAAHLWQAVPGDKRFGVGVAKLAFELSHGLEKILDVVRFKTGVLSSGSGYPWFASADLSANLDTSRTTSHPNVPPLPWPGMAQSWNLLTICLAAFGAIRMRARTFGLVPLAFVACTAAYIVTIGETQARYIFILLPGLVALAAASVASKQGYRSEISQPVVGILAVSLVVLAVHGSARVIAARTNRPVGPVAAVGTELANCAAPMIESQADGAHIRVAPTAPCGVVGFDLPRGTEAVSFFVTRDDFPYPRLPVAAPAFRYTVSAAEQVMYKGELSGIQTARWHELPLHAQSQQSTRVTVAIERIGAADTVLKAGLVYIFGR